MSATRPMHGKDVTLEQMSITYPNGFTAVQPTDLTVRAGEFFSILGPSGCGKTTILRAVSGFVEPTGGRVLIGGEDQAGKTPNQRATALIFQNLALFQLMSVAENVGFGLEARGVGKRARLERAQELLDLVALGDQGHKKPTELSGGQRQRVAIARALAVEPSVLLLDEPLSALDLKLRQHMRTELRAIQQKTGVTFIYITHDQGEALTMSDRIAVMNKGVIEQVGTGDDVYANPTSAFVASFVGEANQFAGRVTSCDGDYAVVETEQGAFRGRNHTNLTVGAPAVVFVRPERMSFVSQAAESAAHGQENHLNARMTRRDLEGAFVTYSMQSETGQTLTLHQTNTGPNSMGDLSTRPPELGESVALSFAPDSAIVLGASS